MLQQYYSFSSTLGSLKSRAKDELMLRSGIGGRDSKQWWTVFDWSPDSALAEEKEIILLQHEARWKSCCCKSKTVFELRHNQNMGTVPSRDRTSIWNTDHWECMSLPHETRIKHNRNKRESRTMNKWNRIISHLGIKHFQSLDMSWLWYASILTLQLQLWIH